MRKHQRTKWYQSRAIAVCLAAAMAVQTAVPAMATLQYEDVAPLNSPKEAQRVGGGKAALSGATPSDPIKKDKASTSNAQLKEAVNLLPNGSFEDTAITNESWKWVWDGYKIPAGWSTWVPKEGNKKIACKVETDPGNAHDGDNYINITSVDKTSRIDLNKPIRDIDKTVDYLCTFWLKTENVEGDGVYARLQRLKKSDGKAELNVETAKITGTSDGWVQYGLMTKDFPSDDNAGIQIDIFAEYASGKIWLDDVQILPTYSITLDKTEAAMFTGDTLNLTASISKGFGGEVVQWYSEDPSIADVSENGVVTAYKMGMVNIVAKTDEFHKVSCKVSVEDVAMRQYYTAIRENWRNRLTGNNVEDTSGEIYQNMMKDLTDKAMKHWKAMEKGGNERTELWSDINFTYKYQNTYNNITEDLGTGFSRIENMATAYSAKGSSLYQNPELKKDIIGALEWAYKNIYNDKMSAQKDTYGNWWHWFIGMPQSLCNTVILMYEDMDKDLIEREARTLESFNWNPEERYVVCGGSIVKNTAGNLIDTSLVSALRSSIGETSKPLYMAREALGRSIGFADNKDIRNGYYEDGSYIDHGNLAYTGGYGSTLLGGMEKILFIIKDSPWDMEPEKLTSIFQWIWNGIRPLYADGAMMDMTTGRGIARPSTNDQTVGRGLLKPITHLADAAPEADREAFRAFARTEIQAGYKYNADYFIGMTVADMSAMSRLLSDTSLGSDEEVYHKNFGAMDKAAYHGENFDLGISMYSKRTGNFEYGNKENKRGWHMSDGALSLYNGDQSQYADVYWPTVDPHRLAGITTDHTEGLIPTENTWDSHVSSKDWVGGSSVLNQYGSVGMDFEGETKSGGISSLKAKKSWFTFPDAVVALGAGINSSEGKPTETIVDNRKAMEDAANAIWVDGNETAMAAGDRLDLPMNWALLEGNQGAEQNIGYYFPEKTEVSILKETRIGNWRDINGAVAAGSANDKNITKSYISFAIDHGTNPQNEFYNYVLLPGRSSAEMAEFAKNPEIKILANTPKVQAVSHTRYGVSGYNFWAAYDGTELDVSAKTPASVTIAEEGGRITAGISNPTQNGKDTKVVLNGIYSVLEAEEGVNVTIGDGKTEIIITGRKDYGKTYEVVLMRMEERISHYQNRIQNATMSEKDEIKAILTELQGLDVKDFPDTLKEMIAATLKAAQEKLTLMETGQNDSNEGVPDGVWRENTKGWWYSYGDGTRPISQWKWVKGHWYHFNQEGYMETGWVQDKGIWYYLKQDGRMAVNEWVFYKEKWYYLTDSGAMLTNTSVEWKDYEYWLGPDGVMVE